MAQFSSNDADFTNGAAVFTTTKRVLDITFDINNFIPWMVIICKYREILNDKVSNRKFLTRTRQALAAQHCFLPPMII